MGNINNTETAIQSSPGEGMRKGTRVGEGAAREVAAYLLDHDGFSGVPVTSLANLSEQSVFFSGDDDDIIQRENEKSGKLGSIQEFIKADAEAEEFGPSLFPLEEVHATKTRLETSTLVAKISFFSFSTSLSSANLWSTAGVGSSQMDTSDGISGPSHLVRGPMSRCRSLNQARAKAS